MKQKAAFTFSLMAIVALAVWFVPGAAQAVEGLVFNLLAVILY